MPRARGRAPSPTPPAAAPSAVLAQAVEKQRKGDDESAAVLARQYVDAGGEDPRGWVILVRALANVGHERAALLACDEALRVHPELAELSVLRALLLTALERYPQAVQAARSALYLARPLPVASLALGVAEARQGNVVSARRAFRSALESLEDMAPDAIVEASGGEQAARLAAIARGQLELLGQEDER